MIRSLAALLFVLTPAVASAQTAGTYDTNGDGTLSVQIIHDDDGPFSELGSIYAMMLTNLLGHFEEVSTSVIATSDYAAGDLMAAEVTFYLGATYDQPLPDAFLADFWITDKPLIWMGYNLWQVSWKDWNDFWFEFGFQHLEIAGNTGEGVDTGFYRYVQYNGTELTKFASYDDTTGVYLNDPFVNILGLNEADPPNILSTIVHSTTGVEEPYIVQKGNLTAIGDMPFTYVHEQDRYLAFADVLHDLIGIDHAPDKNALFRLEDTHPAVAYTDIRLVTNELKRGGQRPWSIAIVPAYRDPLGYYNGGIPESFDLNDRPARRWRSQMRRAQRNGAELILHGYTHQYGEVPNPYNGVTADDFEFWWVPGDEPVAEDSYDWYAGRIAAAEALLATQNWDVFGWEIPHYRASVLDYVITPDFYDTTWHRVVYYPYSAESTGGSHDWIDVATDPGTITDYSSVSVTVPGDRWGGQFFPYVIHRDAYGNKVLPETMGNLEPAEFALGPQYVRLVDDLLANAEANLAVRDGTAGFFYHPYLMQFPDMDGAGGPLALRELIEGVEALGYTFVAPSSL